MGLTRALIPHHNDAKLAGALAGAVEVDEEDAREAVHLEPAAGDLEGLAAAHEHGAQVRVAVPEQGAVAPGEVGLGVRPALDLLEVAKAGIPVRPPVALLREDPVQAVREVGLHEGVARWRHVMVELLGVNGAGRVAGDAVDDTLLDATLGDDAGNLPGDVDVGRLPGERLDPHQPLVDGHG